MLKKTSQAILLLMLSSNLIQGVANAQQPVKYSARVSVKISASGNLQTDLSSYVNRELRALGDVVITDENRTFR